MINTHRARRATRAIAWAVRRPATLGRIADALSRSDGAAISRLVPDQAVTDATLALMRRSGVVERITFTRGGHSWTTDLGDAIGQSLWSTGSYQGGDIARVDQWLRRRGRSGCVVDVGANVGTTALMFAQVGRSVLAIEPVPATFDMLRANVDSNGYAEMVRCVRMAVADTVGEVAMWTGMGSGQAEVEVSGMAPAMERWGTRGVRVHVPAGPLQHVLDVESITADEVALVWADIQGSELALVETGDALWSAGVPLFAEVDPASLELHGGLSAFVEACTARFSQFAPAEEIGAAERPIAELRAWIDAIGAPGYSDALFVP